jgi:tetratricopeptide (TPR) repeat protein
MEIDPNVGLSYFHAGVAYAQKGLLSEALETLEKGKKLVVFPGWAETIIGLIYLKKGDRDKAELILEEMIENRKKIKNLSATCIAFLAAELGKVNLAFEFLDKACEERDSIMVFINIYADIFSPVMAADPRFKTILARMKLDS